MYSTGMLPNALFTGHLNARASNSGNRGLSAELWYKASANMLSPDGYPGTFFFDDFTGGAGYAPGIGGGTTLPSVAGPSMGNYSVYVDTATAASSITQVDNVTGGVCRLSTAVTADHLAIMNTGALGEISRTAGERAVTIFEARIALPTQVTTGAAFCGLATQNAVADGGLIAGAGGLIAAGSGIGFATPGADSDGIDFVYQAGGQALQTRIADLQVATAGTFYKFGFIYNPSAPIDKRITVYKDGVKQTTYVTDTLMSAATFPNSTHMGLHAAVMGLTGVARSLDLDWWAFYQGPIVS